MTPHQSDPAAWNGGAAETAGSVWGSVSRLTPHPSDPAAGKSGSGGEERRGTAARNGGDRFAISLGTARSEELRGLFVGQFNFLAIVAEPVVAALIRPRMCALRQRVGRTSNDLDAR